MVGYQVLEDRELEKPPDLAGEEADPVARPSRRWRASVEFNWA